jgi:hypothetical protein
MRGDASLRRQKRPRHDDPDLKRIACKLHLDTDRGKTASQVDQLRERGARNTSGRGRLLDLDSDEDRTVGCLRANRQCHGTCAPALADIAQQQAHAAMDRIGDGGVAAGVDCAKWHMNDDLLAKFIRGFNQAGIETP